MAFVCLSLSEGVTDGGTKGCLQYSVNFMIDRCQKHASLMPDRELSCFSGTGGDGEHSLNAS